MTPSFLSACGWVDHFCLSSPFNRERCVPEQNNSKDANGRYCTVKAGIFEKCNPVILRGFDCIHIVNVPRLQAAAISRTPNKPFWAINMPKTKVIPKSNISNSEYTWMSGVVPDKWHKSHISRITWHTIPHTQSVSVFSQPGTVTMVAKRGSEYCRWHDVSQDSHTWGNSPPDLSATC